MAQPPEERGVPESLPGAGPGDDEIPEHSHGTPLDEPQPSAPRREDLENEESDDAHGE